MLECLHFLEIVANKYDINYVEKDSHAPFSIDELIKP